MRNIIIVLNKIGQTELLITATPVLNLWHGRNQAQLDDSIGQRRISNIPRTLNVKQSLQKFRRINRLKASAIKKQQLSTQNLVDHVNREAENFDAIDHSNEKSISVFTIKEQRRSNKNESDNESDHGSVHENKIEEILSPPYIPYSPPDFIPNDAEFTPVDDEHTSSIKKLRRNLDPRSDADNESDRDIEKRNSLRIVDPAQI